ERRRLAVRAGQRRVGGGQRLARGGDVLRCGSDGHRSSMARVASRGNGGPRGNRLSNRGNNYYYSGKGDRHYHDRRTRGAGTGGGPSGSRRALRLQERGAENRGSPGPGA